ncbi:MAG: choice-of-anchor U domain-containing protein [Pseudomonadota bacterium]
MATRLVVKDLDDNKDYYFMVRSYNNSGIQSINSNEVRYHTPDIPAPTTDTDTNTNTPPDQNSTIPDSNSDTTPDQDSNTSSGGDDIACDLVVSSSTNRSNSVILEGQTVSGLIYVFTRSDMDMYRVSFYLDDPGMNRTPITIENRKPFDFAGTENDGNAVAFNTAQLSDGPHKITARVNFNGSYIEVPTAEFTVANYSSQEDQTNLTEKTTTAQIESDIADQTDNDSDNIFVSNNTDYPENESAISIIDEFASSLDNVKTVIMEDGQHLTAESSEGTIISRLEIKEKPSSSSIPSDDLEFTYGLVDLTIENVDTSGNAIVKLYLPEGSSPETYYKYGPTPDQPEDHWYEFMYDGETGAQIDENIITLHYVDGKRGDDNLSEEDDKITDTNGGAVFRSSQSLQAEPDEAINLNSNSDSGCFIQCLIF